MKLETFFNKFDELADTPNGVKQLRELVMQLAVEGGLVPHSAAEPAVPYASVEDAEPINVSDVPENWRVVLLADAIKNRSGNSKLIKGNLHEEPAAGRFQGFSASGADVWCDDYEHEGQAIIISAVGARCGKAFKASGKWCAIANTNITRPEPTLLDFDFAYLVLNNEHFWVRGGSAQPFVKFPPSLDRHFALPPLAEQKRIVAKVDELMALCDRLEAQQQERETRHAALCRASLARFADAPTPANLHFLFHSSFHIPPSDLRKSILTLAVQGKLVPQDPNDEPAAISTDFEAQFDIPEKWAWIHLGDLRPEFQNGASSRGDKEGVPVIVIRLADVASRRISLDNPRAIAISKDQIAKYRLKVGDTLITRVNGSADIVGTFIPVLESLDAIYCDHFIRMRIEPTQLFSAYTAIIGDSQLVREQIKNLFITTAGQKTVNQVHIRSLCIPLPPLAEQRRIVAKVEQLMSLVDKLEAQLAASRATAANLLSALVAELTSASANGAPQASPGQRPGKKANKSHKG